MSIDLDNLENKTQATPETVKTPNQTANPTKNHTKLIIGALAVALAGSLLYNCQGQKTEPTPATANSNSQAGEQTSNNEMQLPEGIKKVDKLPFNLPSFLTSEPVDIYQVGSIYVVGTQAPDGSIVYDSLTQDGKYIMATYIADAKTGNVVMDSNGFVTADRANEINATQGAVTQQTGLAPTSLIQGMEDEYFTADLTQGKYSFKPETTVRTPAIGELKANPDIFARHVFDSLYNTTWHSDSQEGKYKNSPHSPMYVVYDPNCPHCQIEIPQIEKLKAQGYPIIYLPVPALSQPPSPLSDDDFHYQLLAPHFGKQDLVASLTKKSEYVRPEGFTLTDEQKQLPTTNRNVFMDIPSLLDDYYNQKYGQEMAQRYGTITNLAVPTVIYMNKETGDVHYHDMTDELLGTSLER